MWTSFICFKLHSGIPSRYHTNVHCLSSPRHKHIYVNMHTKDKTKERRKQERRNKEMSELKLTSISNILSKILVSSNLRKPRFFIWSIIRTLSDLLTVPNNSCLNTNSISSPNFSRVATAKSVSPYQTFHKHAQTN